MEYLRMPARAEWAWMEAYGLLEADPAIVHGADWTAAQQEVEQRLERLAPRARLDAELARGAALADTPPAELFQRGSGWGALERLRRAAVGEPPFCPPGMTFDDASLTAAQAMWLGLLRDGALPDADPAAAPCGFMVQAEWREMLERRAADMNWLGWLHLGILRYNMGDRAGAGRAWQASLESVATPWALRALGVLSWDAEDLALAAERYLAALRLRPELLPLAVEGGQILVEASRPDQWRALLPELPETIRGNGRIRLLEARAALAVGDIAAGERILAERPVVADLREGDTALSDIWEEYHLRRISAAENRPIDAALRARVCAAHPIPAELDFRMHQEAK